MIFGDRKAFQFNSIEDNNEKEYLIIFNGMFYETPSLNDLLKLQELLQNTINSYDFVNNYVVHENKLLSIEIYRPQSEIIKNEKKVTSGFIYIAKCNHTNYYKIGYSVKNTKYRIAQLKTANPTLELYISIAVKNILFEKELHKIFEEKKVRGEWFNLDLEELNYIKNYLKDRNNEV